MSEKTFLIKKDMAEAIWDGTKLFEVRPAVPKFDLAEGSTVKFHWYTSQRLVAKIKRKTKFECFQDLIHELGVEVIMPGRSMDEAIEPRQQSPVGTRWQLIDEGT